MSGSRVLVVDDAPALRGSIERALRLGGYTVTQASDGETALRLALDHRPDVVVLDVLMPGLDGLEVCRAMRAAGHKVPILMLTARDSIADRVAGLDSGADDYLVKPFSMDELLARLRALLRRTGADGKVLQFLDLELDQVTYEVRRGGRFLQLTRTEFRLLELFMLGPKRVLTRTFMLESIWGYDFGPSSNSLEVFIGSLRRKTEQGGEARVIHTVRGVGYVLRES